MTGFLKIVFFKGVKILRKILTIGKERITVFFDLLLLKVRIKPRIKLPKNSFVFVGHTLNHRVIRHARILKANKNLNIIFLIGKNSPLIGLNHVIEQNKIFRFRNHVHLKRIGIESKGKKLKVYAFASKPSYPMEFLQVSDSPFVYDPYDCFSIYYGKKPQQKWLIPEIAGEQFCISRAQGLIARNPELKEASKLFEIKNTNNILFLDYCDENQFVHPSAKDGRISVVYSGGIYGKHELKSSHGLTDFFEIIEDLHGQHIDFHIYPSPLVNKESYYDYLDAQKEFNNFTMHKSVSQSALSVELSQYHYGILPHFKSATSSLSDEKMRTASSLKLFNYLEAGLPVIVSAELEFMAWLVRRYQIGFVIQKTDVKQLSRILSSINYATLQNNVLAAREKLSYKNNSAKLISFIESRL